MISNRKMVETLLLSLTIFLVSPSTLADEFVLFCPLTELQESVYRALLECEDVQLILHAHVPCDCYSGETRGDCCYRVGHTATATVERRGGTASRG